jgi:hypothetical protein
MKCAALAVALLYGIILIVLTCAMPIISFFGAYSKVDPLAIYKELYYWVWFLLFIISQIALLIIPVKLESKRPITKNTVILPILAASIMAGLLAIGAFVSIGELLLHDATSGSMWKLGWVEFALVWLLWALIFRRWSRGTEPGGLIKKMTGVLYKGSILELLVAVPTHIMVRQREYCCAGLATFFGIAMGVAVMLFAFGPAVFFLYADRIRKKTRQII